MARSLRPGRGFELFAEMLLTGLFVAVGSVPVVTAVPSVAAGVAHLRRHVAGGETGVGRFAREWRAAVRDLWLPGLLLPLAVVVGLGNTVLTESGSLPGAGPVRVVTWLAVVAATVVVLRAAGAWSGADGEPGGVRGLAAAARTAQDDLAGSLLLVVGLGLAAVLVWMLLPLAVIAGGLICLAVVGVEARRRERPAAG